MCAVQLLLCTDECSSVVPVSPAWVYMVRYGKIGHGALYVAELFRLRLMSWTGEGERARTHV